uniref:NADH-ubiquinone oxidoreductase chain 5 n=1 Tax=Cheliceroides longipalpis TaxID=1560386 RepID=A0A481N011_9ARAC|nr:NADH dehydrogenase subunit 5 [Cheliceroides longipalpis]QAU56486.1 NADH dehydrogenase subunit 5 [Cheliceroides longipalpis]
MNYSMIIITSMMFITLTSLLLIQNNMFYLIKYSLLKFSYFSMTIDIMLDWMSISFLSTVMIISSLIIIFSKYYIPKKEFTQFLLLLMMFITSMSILILSNNLFMILLGWDGLGLSSYILVIYYQNYMTAASGTITLLSNRVGDILILLSMALIIMSSNWNFNMNMEYSLLVSIMLMIAACSKSAQFPFSAWLPMAMAAPTPISALVHSSTLVTAGVFILMRIMSINHPITMLMLMLISSATAIYSSLSANWEQDMKKIIALSTLSQIAMMMFIISLGSMMLAFMHLIIHALFKSAMFLCAGIMIHESSYQDMRMMGLNFYNSPMTLSILGVNSMALMGLPFMSGFFSKDIIIEKMLSSSINLMMFMLMISSIGMTASYSIRMANFSNKMNMKCNPIMSNHQSMMSFLPIMVLSLFAISSGSWLTWLIMPDQLYLIPIYNKFLILTSLMLGFLLGFSLQFKNNKYIKWGMSSISLWFTHFLSVFPTNIISPLMQIYHNNDKQWQENYGPQKYYNTSSMISTIPESYKSSLLFFMMLISLLPLFILM